MEPLSSQYCFSRRNYVLGVLNGAAFIAAMHLFSPSTVGAVFIAHLTDKKAAVGLVYSLMMVGWVWPQMAMSNVLEHRPFKKPFYVVSAVLRMVIFALILVGIGLIGDRSNTLLLVMYGLLAFSFSSLGGIGIIPFMDIVSKSVPPNRRGGFFSMRGLFGGLLGVAGGVFVKFILSEERGLAFPNDFLIVFFVAFVLLAFSTACFCCCSEPEGAIAAHTMTLRQRMRRGWRIFRRDRNYQRLYLSRAAMAFARMSAPIYVVYAVHDLGAAEHQTGLFLLIGALAASLSTLLWRHIGDVYGNRLLLLVSAVLGLVAPLVATVAGTLPDVAVPAVGLSLPVLVFLAVFATAAAAMSANGIGYTNYLLEIAPETRRPTYVGFMYTIATPLAFSAWLGGLLADATSPQVVFVVSQVFAVAGIWLAWRMDEPRKSRQLASRYVRWQSALMADGVATAASSARPRAEDQA